METKKIKITVTQRTTKDGKKSFNVYKATTKNGNLIDCKFRKEVKNLPEKTCYAIIGVDDMNIDRSKEYPVMWVNAVQSYESLSENAVERNRETINEFFG